MGMSTAFNLTTNPSFFSQLSPSNLPTPFPATLPFKHSTCPNLQVSSVSLSRRMFIPSVSGIWDALTGGSNNNPREAVIAVRRGMLLFRQLFETFSGSQGAEYFYASLYAGLYYESLGKPYMAKKYIVAACQSPYGQRSDDYMASLAKVHCLCRNWELDISQNST
ncbi:hypothetical protein KSS87_008734 [Heliosperma pusillum]|nr:hypothetical protein KSS87_008734 [Heliosperma pusillum]